MLVGQLCMFNPLHSSTNQELFKKHLCKISVTQSKQSHVTTKSTLFAVSKDEWNTKEDAGKSLKNSLYVLQYAKRRLSAEATIKLKRALLLTQCLSVVHNFEIND